MRLVGIYHAKQNQELGIDVGETSYKVSVSVIEL